MFEELNREQRQAVESDHSRILCLAGAGSGKTKTLVSRVARLISEGVDPEEILMLTFTRAAANEQKERIIGIVGDDAQDIVCGTFHSWAVRTIRQFAYRVGLTPSFSVYDDADSLAIMETIIDELQYKLKAEDVIEVMEKRAVYRVPIPADMEKAVDEYRFRLKRNNAIDFNGLIDAVIYLLKDDTIRKVIHSFHKYVFVDEFQDTDHRQMEILEMIDPEHLFVVGDDFQSIYKFRGADVGIIIDLAAKNDWQTIKLERNYRSSKEIVESANSLIKYNNQTEKILKTDRKGPEIEMIETEWPEEEQELIAGQIKKASAEETEYKDIAVLTRTNKGAEAIKETLKRHNIPCEVKTRSADPLATFEAKKLCKYMDVVLNSTDNDAVAATINWPRQRISQMELLKAEVYQIEKNCSLYAALEATETAPEYVEMIKRIKDTIAEIYDEEDPVGAADLLGYCLEELDLDSYYQEIGTTNKIETIGEIERSVLEWAVAITETGEKATAEEWLAYFKLKAIEGSTIKEEEKNAVQIMTAHGSKGLEFKEVIIPGCNAKNYPLGRGDIEEERRLFYVAITRAKERLILTRANKRISWGEKVEETEKSPFIAEMGI